MNQAADALRAPVVPGPTLFGQPRGIATLFLTEMWERFTYYGMRALLILFMAGALAKGGLGINDASASAIYGLYLGSTYLLGLPGGWIADRLLGAQRAVISGGVFIVVGNALLAFGNTALFFIGLLVIALGVGLLKPNVSALVASLYPEGGARRDAGFSIFYMGINLGAFLGSWLVPLFAAWFGWRWGFALPALGMALGVAQFLVTRRYLLRRRAHACQGAARLLDTRHRVSRAARGGGDARCHRHRAHQRRRARRRLPAGAISSSRSATSAISSSSPDSPPPSATACW